MPLVHITVTGPLAPETRRALADGVHQALVETANVPADDRFQVVHELPAGALFWSPSYLGLQHTERMVFVEITLNAGRTVEVKKALYRALADRVTAQGFRREDVLVSLVEVSKENWSFGGGVMSYPPPA